MKGLVTSLFILGLSVASTVTFAALRYDQTSNGSQLHAARTAVVLTERGDRVKVKIPADQGRYLRDARPMKGDTFKENYKPSEMATFVSD